MEELFIVTGGAGFIGSHLVRLLRESGCRVRVVERSGADVRHLGADVEIVRADIRNRAALTDALRGGNYVFHLAANPNLWVRDRREFEEVNHQGAVNVLETALASGARRVLHTSTESILTRANVSGPIDENAIIQESDAVGPYCLSKLRAENAAIALARAGQPVVIACPTMPVGPGDLGYSPPTRLIRDFCLGRLPALMDCTLNLVDVRDVAAGLLRVMDRGQPGRRYILGGENLTLASFLGMLSEVCGVAVPRWRVPYPVGLGIAYISEFWSDHISRRAPRASVTGIRLARRIMHFDVSASRRELGLQPRPLHESVADAVEWLRQTGGIPRPAAG